MVSTVSAGDKIVVSDLVTAIQNEGSARGVPLSTMLGTMVTTPLVIYHNFNGTRFFRDTFSDSSLNANWDTTSGVTETTVLTFTNDGAYVSSTAYYNSYVEVSIKVGSLSAPATITNFQFSIQAGDSDFFRLLYLRNTSSQYIYGVTVYTGGTLTSTVVANTVTSAPPMWLRLRRTSSGNIGAYISTDGYNWTYLGGYTPSWTPVRIKIYFEGSSGESGTLTEFTRWNPTYDKITIFDCLKGINESHCYSQSSSGTHSGASSFYALTSEANYGDDNVGNLIDATHFNRYINDINSLVDQCDCNTNSCSETLICGCNGNSCTNVSDCATVCTTNPTCTNVSVCANNGVCTNQIYCNCQTNRCTNNKVCTCNKVLGSCLCQSACTCNNVCTNIANCQNNTVVSCGTNPMCNCETNSCSNVSNCSSVCDCNLICTNVSVCTCHVQCACEYT